VRVEGPATPKVEQLRKEMPIVSDLADKKLKGIKKQKRG
jgi:hypothetical protein